MIKYKDLLILKLSETTQWKNKKEMYVPNGMMKDWPGFIFTCEFIDLEDKTYILRGYYENGIKNWQIKYKNGQEHGQSIVWYKSGAKHWQEEYQNGELVRIIK